MDAFARGAICALRAAGAKPEDIARTVRKKDGKRPHLRAVDAVLARSRLDTAQIHIGAGRTREQEGAHGC